MDEIITSLNNWISARLKPLIEQIALLKTADAASSQAVRDLLQRVSAVESHPPATPPELAAIIARVANIEEAIKSLSEALAEPAAPVPPAPAPQPAPAEPPDYVEVEPPIPSPAPAPVDEIPDAPVEDEPEEPLPEAPAPERKFRVLNGLLSSGQPEFGERVIQINGGLFPSLSVGDKWVKDADIKAAVKSAQHQMDPKGWNASGAITMIDTEVLPTFPFIEGDAWEHTLIRLADLSKKFKQQWTKGKVGIYSYSPAGGQSWWAIAKTNSQIRNRIHAANNMARDILIPQVDCLMPNCYTYWRNDIDAWVYFARQTIEEGHRIANGKPVYPLIWCEYHENGGSNPPNQYIGDKFWRKQIETMIEYSPDGVILWGGWNFSPNGQQPYANYPGHAIQHELLGPIAS